MMSFTPIGTPCSRPWRGPRSSAWPVRGQRRARDATRRARRRRACRSVRDGRGSLPRQSACRHRSVVAISVAVSVFGPDMIGDGTARCVPRPPSLFPTTERRTEWRTSCFFRRNPGGPACSHVVPLFSPSAACPFVRSAHAQQPSTLRIAMTAGRHPGDRRRARPGHRGHPLHGLHLVRPAGYLGPDVGDGARQARPRARHQVVPGPRRSDEVDLRAAPGREVPSRRAVHRRRRDLQPRAHAERQVAGVRPSRPRGADRRGLADGRLTARSTPTRSSCRPTASTR